MGKYTLGYLRAKVTRKQNRKHGTRRKDTTLDSRNSKYLENVETKIKEFARKFEEAVREFDPFAEDDEIERNKATSTELKKHLDFELRNRDLSFRIQRSDIWAGDHKKKITSVLMSSFTKVESTLKDREESDTTFQEDVEQMQKSKES